MTPEAFAAMTDVMDQMIEMTNAYKAKLEAQMTDIPSPVRDVMVSQFHQALMAQLSRPS